MALAHRIFELRIDGNSQNQSSDLNLVHIYGQQVETNYLIKANLHVLNIFDG